MKTANYPIVVGDVLTAGTEAFVVSSIRPSAAPRTVVGLTPANGTAEYLVPESIVQAIGTTDPATGTPRV